jgi:hypothetical protein
VHEHSRLGVLHGEVRAAQDYGWNQLLERSKVNGDEHGAIGLVDLCVCRVRLNVPVTMRLGLSRGWVRGRIMNRVGLVDLQQARTAKGN